MSELTQCNCCDLRAIKASAKKKGERTIIRPSKDGGFDILCVPKNVKLSDPITTEERDTYFAAWMMAITNSCCC